jgi:hypothetical protein
MRNSFSEGGVIVPDGRRVQVALGVDLGGPQDADNPSSGGAVLHGGEGIQKTAVDGGTVHDAGIADRQRDLLQSGVDGTCFKKMMLSGALICLAAMAAIIDLPVPQKTMSLFRMARVAAMVIISLGV